MMVEDRFVKKKFSACVLRDPQRLFSLALLLQQTRTIIFLTYHHDTASTVRIAIRTCCEDTARRDVATTLCARRAMVVGMVRSTLYLGGTVFGSRSRPYLGRGVLRGHEENISIPLWGGTGVKKPLCMKPIFHQALLPLASVSMIALVNTWRLQYSL